MLIEIPEPEVILGIITSFVIGIIAFFIYNKLKPYVNLKPKTHDPRYMERLEYYERQLIDMKIRLDALDVADLGTKTPDLPKEVRQMEQKLVTKPIESSTSKKVKSVEDTKRMSDLGHGDVVSHVLRLITDKSMTSRDIQITIGRTREHTSRLMKKLFDDGFVERNTSTKPYTYSITKKGREKLGLLGSAPTTV